MRVTPATFAGTTLAVVLFTAPVAYAQGGTTIRPIAAVIRREGGGERVTIAGRASVASGKLQARVFDIAIQDATGGLRVFSRNMAVSVEEGDSVIASGMLKRYRGDLELAANSIVVLPAKPRLVTPRDLPIDGALIGRYPGQLVRVRGRAVRTGRSEGGQYVRLSGTRNIAGDTLTVWIPANHGVTFDLGAVQANDSLTATGIVTAYQDNSDDPVVWQLIPRDARDVVVSERPRVVTPWMLWVALATASLIGLAIVIGRYASRRQLAALRETEARYRQLLALSPDAVLVHTLGIIRFANPAAAQLFGVASEIDLVGQAIDQYVHPDSRAALDAAMDPATLRDSGGAARVRARLLLTDGGGADVEVTSSPCVYLDQPAGVLLARDISAQLRYERDLHALALVDELTGLQNRRGFTLFAEQELARARRNGRTPVLVFADLDGLKQINDAHGHAAGDEALRLTGRALRGILRETDIVARWSGDEFVALMGEGGEAAAESIGLRLDAAIAALAPEGLAYEVTASVGLSALNPTLPLADAMERADADLYAQKKRGRHSGERDAHAHVDSGQKSR